MPTIIVIYFFYGLAFFVLGLVLALASRQASEFKFARAIRPLAAFGIIHGIHEWFEMFQQIAVLAHGHTPTVVEEFVRLALLGVSFVMLLAFGLVLLSPDGYKRFHRYWPILALIGLWLLGIFIVYWTFDPSSSEALAMSDVLMRYMLAIPGALLAAWALMAQQRTFREHHMSQFGRDLIWCAVAFLLYGVIGQLFVRPTALPPSTVINSVLFFVENLKIRQKNM